MTIFSFLFRLIAWMTLESGRRSALRHQAV